MNAEIVMTLTKLIQRLSREVRELPRELLEQMLREESTGVDSAMPDSVKLLQDDASVRLRLLLQWNSQAREQLLSEAEGNDAAKKAAPDLVKYLLSGGRR